MSDDGESDDSTTIRRKILLSPTMPPHDTLDYDGSPLANLVGQVRPDHFAALLIQSIALDSVSNGTQPYGQKLVTSRNTPTFLRCSHHSVVRSSKHADIVSVQQLAATCLKADTWYGYISHIGSQG